MNRRGFLNGLFGGVTAAGLIVAAKPEEIEAFAGPLVRNQPLTLDPAPPPATIPGVGEHLYNARGELVAIITSLTAHLPQPIDVTSWGDMNRRYVQGIGAPEVRIEAVALGTLERDATGFHLRGR